jgi:hypothetical protein
MAQPGCRSEASRPDGQLARGQPASPQFSGWWFRRFYPDNIKALFKESEAASTQ